MRTVARTTAVAAAAVALAVAVPTAAQAKDKLDLDLFGYAAPAAPVAGAVPFSGFVTTVDDTFYGNRFTGSFGPADGTFPQARACEPGTGTLTIGDDRGTVTLAISGEMCENWGTYPTNGTWSVTSGTGRFDKAKGSGTFAWNAQSFGTIWSAYGTFKA